MADWTPENESAVALWLDADDASTITESGGAVSQWDDKSGNGRDVSQATGSKQPTTGTRTINSKNVLDFDRSASEHLAGTGQASWINGTEYTIFAVVECDLSDGGGSNYFIGTLQVGENDKGLHVGPRDTNEFAHRHYGDDYDYSLTRDTDAHLFTLEYKSPDGYLYNNGNYVGAGTAPDFDLNTDNEFAVGTGNRDNDYSFDGKIAEVIITTGLISVTLKEKIEGYLAWKWGLNGSLPSSHQYKNKAPETTDILPISDYTENENGSLDHTVPAGSNRLLVAFFSLERSSSTSITGVTYGGQAMTQAFQIETADSGTVCGVACFYLLEAGIAAASGTAIVPTYSASPAYNIMQARAYENAAQAAPTETHTAETNESTPNPFTTIDVTETIGNLVVAIVGAGNATSGTWQSDMKSMSDYATASSFSTTADRVSSSSSNVTVECTIASQNRAAGGSAEFGKYVAAVTKHPWFYYNRRTKR